MSGPLDEFEKKVKEIEDTYDAISDRFDQIEESLANGTYKDWWEQNNQKDDRSK